MWFAFTPTVNVRDWVGTQGVLVSQERWIFWKCDLPVALHSLAGSFLLPLTELVVRTAASLWRQPGLQYSKQSIPLWPEGQSYQWQEHVNWWTIWLKQVMQLQPSNRSFPRHSAESKCCPASARRTMKKMMRENISESSICQPVHFTDSSPHHLHHHFISRSIPSRAISHHQHQGLDSKGIWCYCSGLKPLVYKISPDSTCQRLAESQT